MKLMKNNLFKLKLLIILLVSFFLSSFLNKEFFFANSPKLKMPPHQYFVYKIKEMIYFSKYGKIAKEIKNKSTQMSQRTIENMQKVAYEPMKKIAPGTYAQQRENVVKITFREDEIEWVEYSYRVNGKEVKVKVPRGGKKPTQKEVEEFFFR